MDKSYSLLKRYKKWCPYKGEGYKRENKTAKTNLAYVFHKKKKNIDFFVTKERAQHTKQTHTRERDPSSTKLKV